MNKASARIVLVAAVLGFGLVACSEPSSEPGGFSELQRVAAPNLSDSEIIMGLLERVGQSTTPRHYHPGGEFGFIVEGTVTVEAEGMPSAMLSAGDSFYQPPGEWHVISTADAGAKTIIFRILENGQPMIVPVE